MICTLSALEIHVDYEGELCVFKSSQDGTEDGEALRFSPYDGPPTRYYHCGNCKQTFPGDDFEPARQHLGKFHDQLHPFDD